MFCKHCGNELLPNDKVCSKCGKPVNDEEKVSGSSGLSVAKSGKSKITAGLLALFLGGLGVHNFYIGKIGAGILELLFCWTGIPSIIALIEGIIILCESDENFERRCNS